MPMATSWVARIRKARKLHVSRESSPVCRDTSSQITASAPSPGASAVALSARSESTSSGMVTEIEPCSWTFRAWSFSTSRSTDSRASRTWMTSPGGKDGRTRLAGNFRDAKLAGGAVHHGVGQRFRNTNAQLCDHDAASSGSLQGSLREPLGDRAAQAAPGAAVIGQTNYDSVTLMLWKPA